MPSSTIKKSSKPVMNLFTGIVICLLILLVGAAGMVMLAHLKKPPAEAKNGERALRVEAIPVKQEDIPVFISGYGQVKPLNVVPIAPEVPGKIIEIHPRLEIGEIIPKGEILFRIDPKDYLTIQKICKERLRILDRNQALAKIEYDRVRVLFEENNVGTQANVEAAEKAMLSAADLTNQISQVLETAETNLERCEVRVPFNARVKSVSLENGQYVTPGQNVMTLANDAALEIHVPLDSRDARKWLRFKHEEANEKIAWFSAIQQVTCKIRWTENNNGQTWNGRLHRVVEFDQQTRTLTVAVRVDAESAKKNNPKSLPLVDGMFCSVEIPGRTMHSVFQLPRHAVSFENTVYISVGNHLKTVPVNVERIDDDYAYVADGLKAGDMVVITRLIDPLENSLLEITNKTNQESQL